MSQDNLMNRLGIPSNLKWGYLGILIFMMGDGVEQGWLSPYLIEHGMSIQQSATLFTVYGITIAISSWFSGVLAESYGPRKAMAMGLLLYIIGTIGFVGMGMAKLDYTSMLFFYAIRGFGYPLFCLFVYGLDYLSRPTAYIRTGSRLVLVCLYGRIERAGCLLLQLGIG